MRTLIALSILLTTPSLALAQDTPTPTRAAPSTTRLRVLVTPEDATISIAGDVVGSGSAELSLLPGTHTVRIEREGYTSKIETIMLAEDNPGDIILRVHLSRTPPTPVISTGRSGGLVDSLGDARPLTGAVGLGIGLVAASIAIAASSAPSPSCTVGTPETCNDRDNIAGWSTVTGVAGGLLLAGGVSLLVWDAIAGSPASLSVTPTSSGAAASLRFKF